MGISARRLTPAEGRESVQARSSGGVGEGCTIQVLDFAGKTRFLRAGVGGVVRALHPRAWAWHRKWPSTTASIPIALIRFFHQQSRRLARSIGST